MTKNDLDIITIIERQRQCLEEIEKLKGKSLQLGIIDLDTATADQNSEEEVVIVPMPRSSTSRNIA